ncbi:MAG TPA: Lpg1974 family pore-forming outer membrane protein [Rhabdochlamydiaceae bacterium]|nr:Lpg1974 family pore-forming outer membrane protein [Rhabdochlamydiaceae bacterium]
MNKKSITFAVSLISISFLHADEADHNYEERLSALEKRTSVNEDAMRPNVCHWTKESYHFSFDASGLAWKAREDKLDFVIKSDDGLSNHARTVRPDFEWDGGVKLAFGYHVPYYKMDVNLNWTHLTTDADRHVSASCGGNLYSIWSLPSADLGPATDARSRWNLHLNILNFEMGGQFFPRRWLHLRPFIGLSSAWVRQKYDIDLSSASFSKDDIDMRNRFWGIGPRGGFDTIWEFGYGISAFGDVAVSILYGFFETRQKEDVLFAGSSTKTPLLDERDSFRTSRTVLEYSLGLRWDRMFKNNRYHFGLQFGWDNLILYQQNELKRFVDDVAIGVNLPVQGDLTIQGWSVKAMFGF